MAGQIVAFVGLANNAKYVCFLPKPLGKNKSNLQQNPQILVRLTIKWRD
tara:strand:- start:3293 stop:3439 length:147 start_codon:yes stop_codon:yes gene_type:complete